MLLALVSAGYGFVAVDIGSYGKHSDGGIFAISSSEKRLEINQIQIPQPKPLHGTNYPLPHIIIVGDEAFSLN